MMTECEKAKFLVSAQLHEFPSFSREIFGNPSSGAKTGKFPLRMKGIIRNEKFRFFVFDNYERVKKNSQHEKFYKT